MITKEQWTAVARQLGDNWKKLASELRFSGEDISDFEALPDADTGLPAAKMIYLWQVGVEAWWISSFTGVKRRELL